MNIELICWCGCHYYAREVDLRRGWGKSCSKSCAATKRDYGRPNPKRVDGLALPKIDKMKKVKRSFIKKSVYNSNEYQKDGIHPIGYGHIMASGDEGHGQE